MSQYEARFFPNGRVYFLGCDLLQEALDAEKEILIIMNAWSGGYALAIGANKHPAQWDFPAADPDDVCYEMYSYHIEDKEFTHADLAKFHRVIFTSGEQIRMMTGNQATEMVNGNFRDWDTTYEQFKDSYKYAGETKEEFEALRFKVDAKATANSLSRQKDAAEKIKALSGYREFRELAEQPMR